MNATLMALLGAWLSTNATLTELDLTGNAMETKDVESLLLSLRTNSTLQRLRLTDCALPNEAMRALTALFEHNKALPLCAIK